jgi:drug/metabolite transporter (DMT)-like permease
LNVLTGILLKLASTLLFATMDVMVRWVGHAVPVGEVVFFRSFFGFIPLVVLFAWRGELRTVLHTTRPTGQAIRGLLGVGGMSSNFAALARLPVADVMAIYFSAPLMTVALAALILREKVHIYRWSAVIVGFIGVMLTLVPHLSVGQASALSAAAALGALLALLCAGFDAGAAIQMRRLTSTESTASIVFYFSLMCMLAGLCTLPFGWVWPTQEQFIGLILIGILGGTSHLFLTESFRYAAASVTAPFDYAAILWGTALGYMMFGEIPGPLVLAGAAVVTAAGLFVIWRERQLGLKRPQEMEGPAATT